MDSSLQTLCPILPLWLHLYPVPIFSTLYFKLSNNIRAHVYYENKKQSLGCLRSLAKWPINALPMFIFVTLCMCISEKGQYIICSTNSLFKVCSKQSIVNARTNQDHMISMFAMEMCGGIWSHPQCYIYEQSLKKNNK